MGTMKDINSMNANKPNAYITVDKCLISGMDVENRKVHLNPLYIKYIDRKSVV